MIALVLLNIYLPDWFIFECSEHPPFSINVDCGLNQTMVHDILFQVTNRLEMKIEAPWLDYQHFGLIIVCLLLLLGAVVDILIVWAEGRLASFDTKVKKDSEMEKVGNTIGEYHCKCCRYQQETGF